MLFCDEETKLNQYKFLEEGTKIQKHISDSIKHSQNSTFDEKASEYVKTHVPDFGSRPIPFPVVNFFCQPPNMTTNDIDADCVNNEHMVERKIVTKHQQLMNRRTDQGEDELAQTFLHWSSKPLVVIPSFKYFSYLKGYDKEFFIKLELEDKSYSGDADVICVTQDAGIFVCELKASEKVKQNEDLILKHKRITSDIRKSWYQTLKGRLIIKCINSDIFNGERSEDEYDNEFHRITCFPNLTKDEIQEFAPLCNRHTKCCISKERCKEKDSMSAFIDDYLKLKATHLGNNANKNDKDKNKVKFETIAKIIILLLATVKGGSLYWIDTKNYLTK